MRTESPVVGVLTRPARVAPRASNVIDADGRLDISLITPSVQGLRGRKGALISGRAPGAVIRPPAARGSTAADVKSNVRRDGRSKGAAVGGYVRADRAPARPSAISSPDLNPDTLDTVGHTPNSSAYRDGGCGRDPGIRRGTGARSDSHH